MANASALFIDRGGRVIASTDRTRPVGSRIELDPQLLSLDNGRSVSRVVEHDGQYAVMACCASSGYREFKVSDGYRDDVLAVVFRTFGAVCPRPRGATRKAAGAALLRAGTHADTPGTADEFATFFVDGMLFAVPAASVLEARSAAEISRVSMGGRRERMGVIATRANRFVWVFDLGYLMRDTPSTIDHASQAILLRHGNGVVAILADDLDSVPRFHPSHIVPSPVVGGADGLLVKQVVHANGGDLLVQVLDVPQLFACIEDPSLPTALSLDVLPANVKSDAIMAA
jgi:chemotaxis signal transduction protein